jgi:hypothetical protein
MSASKHTFSYRFIDDTKFIRPYISVSLHSKNGSIPSLLALVDSGADFCMVDGALASVLDLDLSLLQQIELSGINGSAVGYVAHLEIGVNDHFIPAPVVFSFDFSPVGFGGIIGQVGFFDAFKVQFDRAHREVHLT